MKKDRKKICIFSAQYLPHLGGVERYTYNLAKKLQENGNKVVIVTSRTGQSPFYEVQDGVEIYRIPCWTFMSGRYPVLKVNSMFFKIHRRLMKDHFDLIMINTRFYPHSVYGTLLAKWKKTKCIIVEHGTSYITVNNPVGNLIEKMLEHLMAAIEKINCKEFYGVSQACTEWLKHFHIKADGVLYNAIDLRSIEEIKKQPGENYREKYKIPENGIIVTFTGRLLKEKGIFQLMEAVNQLRSEGIPVYLMVAGDGEEKEKVRKQKKEGTIVLGKIGFQEIVNLLKQSDIFCLPTGYPEGFPTSVLEAAACQCYIITTDRGGSKEMISSSEYGTIMKENDTETVKRALKEVIFKEEYRKKAINKTYERLKENYTWDIVAEKVYEIASNK